MFFSWFLNSFPEGNLPTITGVFYTLLLILSPLCSCIFLLSVSENILLLFTSTASSTAAFSKCLFSQLLLLLQFNLFTQSSCLKRQSRLVHLDTGSIVIKLTISAKTVNGISYPTYLHLWRKPVDLMTCKLLLYRLR